MHELGQVQVFVVIFFCFSTEIIKCSANLTLDQSFNWCGGKRKPKVFYRYKADDFLIKRDEAFPDSFCGSRNIICANRAEDSESSLSSVRTFMSEFGETEAQFDLSKMFYLEPAQRTKVLIVLHAELHARLSVALFHVLTQRHFSVSTRLLVSVETSEPLDDH